MIPIVLTACIMSPEVRTYRCVDDMTSFRTTQSVREEPRQSVLSVLFDAFSGSTAEEREKAAIEREDRQIKQLEDHLQALKKKDDPTQKEFVKTLESSIKVMKKYRAFR